MRHWLAYRERWQDEPKVITPRDDDDLAEWRRLGYRVEGPFVLEGDAGAVAERDALRKAVRAYLNGAPLDEHGRFKDPAREVLYRAAGGQ
jgi:hypothetical protein